MGKKQRPVVCVLITEASDPGQRLLIQRRSKPDDDTPYSGYLELPQGKVNAGESLASAAIREVREEAGIEVTLAQAGAETSFATREVTSDILIAEPALVVVDPLQNHIGIPIFAIAIGNPSDTIEATSHSWMSRLDLANALANDRIFPLNRPMIRYFLTVASEVIF